MIDYTIFHKNVKKSFLVLAIGLLGVVLAGCPYGSSVAVQTKAKPVKVANLVGKWKSNSVGLNDIEIKPNAKQKRGYSLVLASEQMYGDDGFVSLPAGSYDLTVYKFDTTLVVQAKEDSLKYHYFKLKQLNTNTFALWEFDDTKAKEKFTDGKELYTYLKKIANDKTYYGRLKLWERR